MIVNSKIFLGIQNSFNTLFNKGIGMAKPTWEQLAMLVPSSTRSETYAWLGAMPGLKEWIGERVLQKLQANGYTLDNKPFEDSVTVNRDDIEDDTYGVYAPLVQGMGTAATMWPDELVYAALAAGFSEKCYDGKPFFSADHLIGKKKISNMSTAALDVESYVEARTAIMSYTNEKVKPLGLVPNLLVVPPSLEGVARKIVKAENIAQKYTGADGKVSYVPESNVYKDTAEVLVVPQLAAAPKAWFLLDTTKAIKPLIFQRRKAPEFVAMTAPDDYRVFMNKEFIYGVEARGNAGYTLWQLAYGSTGEGE